MQCFTCTIRDKTRTITDVFLCQNENIHRNMLLEGFPGRAGLPLISPCPPFPVTHGTGTTPFREELCLPEMSNRHWFPPWIIKFEVLSKIYFSGLWQYTVTPSPVSRVSGWEKDPVPLTDKALSQQKTPNVTLDHGWSLEEKSSLEKGASE